MKGNNELRLSPATVIEALQEYLDKRYTPNVVVQSVEKKSEGYGDDWFVVKVAPKETPAP